MLTLVYELVGHGEKLARILASNLTISEKIDRLVAEDPDAHHTEMLNTESLFKIITNEILEGYRSSTKGTDGPPWISPSIIFDTIEEDTAVIPIRCTYNYILLSLYAHDGEYIQPIVWRDYILSNPNQFHRREFHRNG